MYDEAFKKQPGNEELGAQTFMANAKISNWKAAQQVSFVLPSLLSSRTILVVDHLPLRYLCFASVSTTHDILPDFHQNAQNFQRRAFFVLEYHVCCTTGTLKSCAYIFQC